MTDHAWIDYEWQGNRYRFQGKWPSVIMSKIGEVWRKASEYPCQQYGDFLVALLKEADAIIHDIHSIRTDGSIHPEDLPDLIIP